MGKAFAEETTVNTNNVSTNTSTINSTNTNTNTNVNTTTVDSVSTNTNTNTNTNTSTNTNYNYGDTTSNNVNTNTNTNNNTNVNTTSSDNTNRTIMSGEVTNRNFNENKNETTIRQPPPTAIAPAMMSGGNNDLCTTGQSSSVQSQIMGLSSGKTVRDMNCERLKNAKTLYDMGMKVAAVATLCQDRRVFDAMWNAGTPCPYEGMIGTQARAAWEANPQKIPPYEKEVGDDFYKKAGFSTLLGILLILLL
jgi:hypothetical protein